MKVSRREPYINLKKIEKIKKIHNLSNHLKNNDQTYQQKKDETILEERNQNNTPQDNKSDLLRVLETVKLKYIPAEDFLANRKKPITLHGTYKIKAYNK